MSRTSCSTRTSANDILTTFTLWAIPATHSFTRRAASPNVSAAEESLRRLQTDYIHLYQSHTDDADTPLEETLGAYADLIKQGKVRAIGASV